jgi:NAD+ kinase
LIAWFFLLFARTVCGARPLVLSPDESIAICAGVPSKGARVDADGVFEGVLEPGQQVTVTRSDLCARFIRLKERSFYSVLRNKLMEQQT